MKEQSSSLIASQGGKILNWYGVKLVHKNSYSILFASYLRQLGANKPVYVEQFMIFNRGTTIDVTISCREEEKNTTYKDLWSVKDNIQLLK